MMSFLIAVALLLFFAGLLVLPILRGRVDGFRYYVSGRSEIGDLLLRRRVLLENLRDLEIERDQGKLEGDEFQSLALPIAVELQAVETRVQKERGITTTVSAPRTHRLGFTCPVCGCLNRHSIQEACFQCGASFK